MDKRLGWTRGWGGSVEGKSVGKPILIFLIPFPQLQNETFLL